jgi:sialate O-acetylesterase
LDGSKQVFWPTGRRCAVSITYDDALPVHYKVAGPALESRGLRGTFYLNVAGGPSTDTLPWRELASQGHELGNHSVFHPCRRDARGRSWVGRDFDLRRYTNKRFLQEIRLANTFLSLVDGLSERTYAYTCFDTHLGRWPNKQPIAQLIRSDFIAARGGRTEKPIVISRELDLMNLGGFLADGLSEPSLFDTITMTRNQGGWLILVIHGIGSGTHESFIETSIHDALIDFLTAMDIWVAPTVTIAKWVRAKLQQEAEEAKRNVAVETALRR